MTSTTSGTTNFTMDVDDIIRLALAPSGGEHSSVVEMEDARTALNILLISMQNKNVPLHKLDTVTLNLNGVLGTSSYTLNSNINDVFEMSIYDSTETERFEQPIERYGLREFQDLTRKTLSEKPTVFAIERKRDACVLKLWPIPDKTTYVATMLVSKKIEDVTASYQKIDIPSRYYPLVLKWLTYELSLLRQGIPEDLRTRLKNEYVELLPETFDEDRERVDTIIVPAGISGR